MPLCGCQVKNIYNMKKIIIALATLAIFASCNKAEVIDVDRHSIAFGGAFIDNATKSAVDGSYSGTKKLQLFNVYGSVTGSGNTVVLFDGDEVTGKIGDAVWSCDEEQYWAPNSSYLFYAIADATSVSPAEGMPTTITYNETSTPNGDLLFASVEDATNASATPAKGNPVKFTFTHLLSKAKFTFKKNAYTNTRYTYTVRNIKFTDAYQEGVYTIATSTWGSQDDKGVLSFGNLEGNLTTTNATAGLESATERQFVPATYTEDNQLTITFDVVMMLDGVEISSVPNTQKFPAEDEFTFAKNTAYNFAVLLGDNNRISFTVEALDAWDIAEDDIDIQ